MAFVSVKWNDDLLREKSAPPHDIRKQVSSGVDLDLELTRNWL